MPVAKTLRPFLNLLAATLLVFPALVFAQAPGPTPGPTSSPTPSPMEAADAAANQGDFEQAATLYEQATRDPRALPSAAATAYLRLGVVRSVLGDESGAQAAFEWAIAIDPAIPTPPELGPESRAGLDRLRTARGSRPMAVSFDAPSEADRTQATTIVAAAEGAPSGHHVQVRIVAFPDGDDSEVREVTTFDRAALELPPDLWPHAREIMVRATVHDAGGPALVRRDSRITRLNPLARVAALGPATPAGPTVFEEPWFWVVVGVVVAGGVTGAVVANEVGPVRLTIAQDLF